MVVLVEWPVRGLEVCLRAFCGAARRKAKAVAVAIAWLTVCLVHELSA